MKRAAAARKKEREEDDRIDAGSWLKYFTAAYERSSMEFSRVIRRKGKMVVKTGVRRSGVRNLGVTGGEDKREYRDGGQRKQDSTDEGQNENEF